MLNFDFFVLVYFFLFFLLFYWHVLLRFWPWKHRWCGILLLLRLARWHLWFLLGLEFWFLLDLVFSGYRLLYRLRARLMSRWRWLLCTWLFYNRTFILFFGLFLFLLHHNYVCFGFHCVPVVDFGLLVFEFRSRVTHNIHCCFIVWNNSLTFLLLIFSYSWV